MNDKSSRCLPQHASHNGTGKALNVNRGRLKMVEVFIAWNQNYNKFIDFIKYHIRRTTNSELIIHVFLARNVAEEDWPRDLEYVCKHECLTNTADSAEAHLIAYILRHYLSEEKTATSQGKKLLLLAQTRPGQHEELVMLLSGMPEFASRNIAKIYRIDEEFKLHVADDLTRQHEFSQKASAYRKSRHHQDAYLDSEISDERREARTNLLTIYPEFHWGDGYKRAANNFRTNTNLDLNGANRTGHETYNFISGRPVYATNVNRRELSDYFRKSGEREIENGSKQIEESKGDIEIITNYERHGICDECVRDRRNADIFEAPSTRRTWPSTQSGRRRREERTKICGLCMERFHCIHTMGEMNTKVGTEDSFESNFDDIGNSDRKFEANRVVQGSAYHDTTPLEEQITPRPNFALWANNKASPCDCTDTRICTGCFLRRLEEKGARMNEKDSRRDRGGFLTRDIQRERPDTSPAALQGNCGGKKNQAEDSRAVKSNNKSKDPEVSEHKAQIIHKEATGFADDFKEVAIEDDLPAEKTTGGDSSENNGGDFEKDFVKNGSLPKVSLKEDRKEFMSPKELSSSPEGNNLHDDSDFQNNLEKLLARLDAGTSERYIREKSSSADENDNTFEKTIDYVSDSVDNEIRDLLNRSSEAEEQKLNNGLEEYADINKENKSGTPSRIHSNGTANDKERSQDILAAAAENQGKKRLKSPRTHKNNRFDYDIFDQIDKNLEIGGDNKKVGRRDKQRSNQGDAVTENGKYTCRFCPEKKFKTAHVWKIHMKNSHKKCNCPCGEYFETREDYLAHFYKLFPLACFLERKCPERFRSLYFQAVHHREKHFSDRPFYCVQCFDGGDDAKSPRRVCFKDIKSLRIHAESMGHDPNEMFLISSQSETDTDTLPWSMKCSGIDFC